MRGSFAVLRRSTLPEATAASNDTCHRHPESPEPQGVGRWSGGGRRRISGLHDLAIWSFFAALRQLRMTVGHHRSNGVRAFAGSDDTSVATALDSLSAPSFFNFLRRPGITLPGCHMRVLVAEDEKRTRAILVEMVQSLGCEVFEAGSGFEAVKRVQEHHPDVLLLDGLLPEIEN